MVFPAAQEVYVHIAPPRLPRVRIGTGQHVLPWGDGFIEPVGIQDSNVTTHHWSQDFCDFTLTNRSRRLNLHFPKILVFSCLSEVARSPVKAGPPEVKRCQAVWNTLMYCNLVETLNFSTLLQIKKLNKKQKEFQFQLLSQNLCQF